MKFGGSCLKNTYSLRRVFDIIKKEDKPIVVVSALSGITDRLISLMKGEDNIDSIISEHRLELRNDIGKEYERELCKKKEILEALLTLHKNTKKVEFIGSHIQSFGERLSALMVAYFLKSKGIMAINIESESLGIVTKRGFTNAIIDDRISIPNTRAVLSNLIKEGFIPVITGYFGVDEQGHVGLLGRNGTDYTAAYIAHAMNEKRIILFKDVPGFYTADPKKVKDSKLIRKISYEQAYELSSYGAGIIHPFSILEAKKSKSTIIIKDFQEEITGTIISEEQGKEFFVTSKTGVSIIRIIVPDAFNTPGVLYRILEAFDKFGINILQNFTSFSGLTAIISDESIGELEKLKRELSIDLDFEILKRNVSIVSIVGNFSNGFEVKVQKFFISIEEGFPDKVSFFGVSSPGLSMFAVANSDVEVELLNKINGMIKDAAQ